MRRIIYSFFIMLLYAHVVFADGNRNGEIQREHFIFIKEGTGDTIGFSDNVNHLEKVFGKSISGISPDLSISWDGLVLKLNPKLEFDVITRTYRPIPDEYIIVSITIENFRFSTIDGITVGADVESVEKIYGEPFLKRSMRYTYYYNDTEDVWNLLFYFNNGKVERIRMLRGD